MFISDTKKYVRQRQLSKKCPKWTCHTYLVVEIAGNHYSNHHPNAFSTNSQLAKMNMRIGSGNAAGELVGYNLTSLSGSSSFELLWYKCQFSARCEILVKLAKRACRYASPARRPILLGKKLALTSELLSV